MIIHLNNEYIMFGSDYFSCHQHYMKWRSVALRWRKQENEESDKKSTDIWVNDNIRMSGQHSSNEMSTFDHLSALIRVSFEPNAIFSMFEVLPPNPSSCDSVVIGTSRSENMKLLCFLFLT